MRFCRASSLRSLIAHCLKLSGRKQLPNGPTAVSCATSPTTGLLFDDAGHRMVPTHATKAGVRYRYYVSTPFLHGEAKTASAAPVSPVPATDTEETTTK